MREVYLVANLAPRLACQARLFSLHSCTGADAAGEGVRARAIHKSARPALTRTRRPLMLGKIHFATFAAIATAALGMTTAPASAWDCHGSSQSYNNDYREQSYQNYSQGYSRYHRQAYLNDYSQPEYDEQQYPQEQYDPQDAETDDSYAPDTPQDDSDSDFN